MKLEKATTGDIVLSIVIPGWGVLVGLIALAKREFKRGLTMLAISSVIIALYVTWQLSRSPESAPPAAVATSSSIDDQLLAAANEITRGSPNMVDADTRIDGAVAGPGRTFTYLYSMPKIASTQIEPGTFEEKVVPAVRAAGCGSIDLKPFFDSGVSVHYKYRGSDGGTIGEVVLNSQICAQR
jgi:hypothetical protein